MSSLVGFSKFVFEVCAEVHDVVVAGDAEAPIVGDGVDVLEEASEGAGDCSRGVGVVAKIDGFEDGFLIRHASEQAPDGGFEGVNDVAG